MAIHEIHEALPFKAYRDRTDFVSISELKSFEQSPYSYYKRYIEKIPDPNAKASSMAFGTLCHTLILEPEKFEAEFAVCDMKRDERSMAYRDFMHANEGKSIITEAELSRARKCADSAAPFMERFQPLIAERSYFYSGPKFMRPVKARLDGYTVNGNLLFDLKTTSDLPTDENCAKTILNFKYHLQVAWYLDIHAAVTGIPAREFYILFQQTQFPYASNLMRINEDTVDIGRDEYQAALRRLDIALKRGSVIEFPRMVKQSGEGGLPGWYIAKQKNEKLSVIEAKL